MTDTIQNLHDTASGSRFVSRDIALTLLSRGCAMCGRSLIGTPTELVYETSDLWVIGLDPTKVAELQIASFDRGGFSSETVLIVDKRAAVCLKCWVEFLRQVVALKGKES